ncbi:hypothetical protein EPN52_02750 [bacterium]|nr:MAG: hypothetical protein EPN52_02750 [bacterium]
MVAVTQSLSSVPPIDLAQLFAESPKAAGSHDRCVPLARTLELVPELRRRYGITRISDATRLDRVAIPTICAIVPDSDDVISNYSGKGATYEHALASAVMEATERQICARFDPPTVSLRPCDIGGGIDLKGLGLYEEAWDRPCQFVAGIDAISAEVVPVPLALVRCPWNGPRTFDTSSTNGLASGNNLTEAVYHALFELVERHVWSMTHARAHLRPRFLLEAFARRIGVEPDFSSLVDDAVAKEIRLPTGCAAVDSLIAEVEAAGLSIRVLALEEPGLPVCIIASIRQLGVDPPLAHAGLGCSWSPEHAAMRAITEAVQGRLVDFQGAREDMLREDDPRTCYGNHGRRRSTLPHGRWYFDAPAQVVTLHSISDRSCSDLGRELRALVDAVDAAGAPRVVVVDLSPSDLPISVARVIVPGLETGMVDGRIGAALRRVIS